MSETPEISSIFSVYRDLNDPMYVEKYDLGGCFTARDMDGPILELDVAVALIRFDGNVSEVAAAMKRSRRVVDTYISRNPALQEMLEDLHESYLDKVESNAKKLARAGESTFVRFVLSTVGKKRGYVPRMEATGKDGQDLGAVFYLPDNGRDAKEPVSE